MQPMGLRLARQYNCFPTLRNSVYPSKQISLCYNDKLRRKKEGYTEEPFKKTCASLICLPRKKKILVLVK